MSIKGDWKRPRTVTQEEEALRWMLIIGQISLTTFNRRFAKLKQAGLIKRSGRVLK